jgi:hypothetical protein
MLGNNYRVISKILYNMFGTIEKINVRIEVYTKTEIKCGNCILNTIRRQGPAVFPPRPLFLDG